VAKTADGGKGGKLGVSKHNVDYGRGISPVDSVGHLSQDSFVSVLRECAVTAKEEEVLNIIENLRGGDGDDDGTSETTLSVHTNCGVWNCDYLVACDGAHSTVRSLFLSGGDDVENRKDKGTKMRSQHLLNIHFKTSHSFNQQIKLSNPAMLYFIFNENMVGCFVAHDLSRGEWVCQVPYFPPYQSVEDYTPDVILKMLLAGLGMKHDANDMEEKIVVLGVRSWIMDSVVQSNYVLGRSCRVLLAGDAAHVFPPAGGLGMNTGLQDVHNLAWRLALASSSSPRNVFTKNILDAYGRERRPVAEHNAALSVRNYERTLEVARAAGLDANHPHLLMKAFREMPSFLLTDEQRSFFFSRAVEVGMAPLRALRGGGAYATLLRRRVEKVLENEGGLPLVFPQHELGFVYGCEEDDWSRHVDDTGPYVPELVMGGRMPHCTLSILRSNMDSVEKNFPGLIIEKDITDKNIAGTISTVDISMQLMQVAHSACSNRGQPCFTALIVEKNIIFAGSSLHRAQKIVEDQWQVSLPFVQIRNSTNDQKAQYLPNNSKCNKNDDCIENQIILTDCEGTWMQLLKEYEKKKKNITGQHLNRKQKVAMLIVRPDGHIGSVIWIPLWDSDNAQENYDMVKEDIDWERALDIAMTESVYGSNV